MATNKTLNGHLTTESMRNCDVQTISGSINTIEIEDNLTSIQNTSLKPNYPSEITSEDLMKSTDTILGIFIVCPAVAMTWRGLWDILDEFLLPVDIINGSYISFFGSITIHLVTCMVTHKLPSWFPMREFNWRRIIGTTMFNAISAFSTINQWRGTWNICAYFIGENTTNLLIAHLCSVTFLCLNRTSSLLLAAPFVFLSDWREDAFNVLPRFRTERGKPCLFMLDWAYSIVVIQTVVVMAWWSTWTMLDTSIFPENHFLSNMLSLLVGIIIALFGHSTEKMFVYLSLTSRKVHLLLQIVTEDFFNLLAFIGCVMVWRGIWFIIQTYMFPGTTLSAGISLCIGYTTLLLLYCPGTLSSINIPLDGSIQTKSCRLFQISYTRAVVNMIESRHSNNDNLRIN